MLNYRYTKGDELKMNYYDNEEHIIRLVQSVPLWEVAFINPSYDAIKFFFSIRYKGKFRNWMNNSRKNALPPDFFSDKYQYMLEVMRTDDYVVGRNSPNALESRFIKNVEDMRRENGVPSLKESRVDILLIPDMSNVSENGYSIYIENFRRIIQKHVSKITNYRKNHNGYKLGFLIFDEAPVYMRVMDKNIVAIPGAPVKGFPHKIFRDRNLVESFINADVDFVIWVTPYKRIPGNPRMNPLICVFDMRKRKVLERKLINYNVDEMMCLEVKYPKV